VRRKRPSQRPRMTFANPPSSLPGRKSDGGLGRSPGLTG
jgi:hypothetical protein